MKTKDFFKSQQQKEKLNQLERGSKTYMGDSEDLTKDGTVTLSLTKATHRVKYVDEKNFLTNVHVQKILLSITKTNEDSSVFIVEITRI